MKATIAVQRATRDNTSRYTVVAEGVDEANNLIRVTWVTFTAPVRGQLVEIEIAR